MDAISEADFLDALCRENLSAFTEKSFSITEPTTPFEHNWHIDCLPYEAILLTPYGPLPVGEIVESKYMGEVLSFNHATAKLEWKKVTAHMINPCAPLYDMVCDTGEILSLTYNHPIYANGKYKNCENVRVGDEIMRILPRPISLLSRCKNKILQYALFRKKQGNSKKFNMSFMQGAKNISNKHVSSMLPKIPTNPGRYSMYGLRSYAFANSLEHCSVQAHKGRILHPKMLCKLCEGLEQSGLYRWWKSGNIPSKRISDGKEEDYKSGWRQVLSLFLHSPSSFRRSPYRPRKEKQRALELGNALSAMPQQTKGNTARNFKTGKCHVRSIVKSLRISKKTYNIEVEGNNNYFANGILVHNCVTEHLQAVWDFEIQNMIINMPPRTYKTGTTSVAFPAWGLGKNPAIKFMLTSFKGSLAEKMTRRTRMILKSEWYKGAFPGTALSEELNRQYYFETTAGGQYWSSSMPSATGEGCDIQLCDDPLSPDEALSDQVRTGTIETIRGTLFSRFNDPRTGRFILIMHRLHDDDPTGNLLKDQGWYHLKLPAEAKGKSYSYTARGKTWRFKEGDLLFKSRFTPEVLERARERLGDYAYAGQYLQEPVPIGGGLIRQEWLQYYPPGSVKPKEMNIVILVDPAGGDDEEKRKKDKPSDWTAMMVVGLAPDNNYYLLDIVRDRLNPTERIDTLFILHRHWNALTGKSPKVGWEKYSMQSDTHYIEKKKNLESYHFPLVIVAGPKGKTQRVSRLVPDMQNGRWYLPQSLIRVDGEGRRWDLVQELINTEIKTFPASKYDDMLDALSRVYEPELNLVFPKPKIGTVAKARRAAVDEFDAGNWEDF